MGQLAANRTHIKKYRIGKSELEKIDSILGQDLVASGVQSALLIDMAGNIISKQIKGICKYDISTFAALASAIFCAVETMARSVGEKEFSLLFHKGKNSHTHYIKINKDFLLITTIGNDMALGTFRMKIADAIRKIRHLWEN